MNSSSKLILGVVCFAVFIQWRLSCLNLWPVATILPPLQPFPSNDSRLTGKVEIIGKGDLLGPESLIVGKNPAGKDVLFTGLTDGRIVRIEENGGNLSWVSLVRTGSIPLSDTTTCGKGWFADTSNTEAICGRPLGMELAMRSTVDPKYTDETSQDEEVLVIADPYVGLLMITGIYGDIATRHVLATRANTDPEDHHFRLLNGIVQAPDGSLYITETSQHFQRRRIFYAALDGKPTGRLLRYTKETGNVEVVATNIFMANGVVLSHDEKHVLDHRRWSAGVEILVGCTSHGSRTIHLRHAGYWRQSSHRTAAANRRTERLLLVWTWLKVFKAIQPSQCNIWETIDKVYHWCSGSIQDVCRGHSKVLGNSSL